MKKTIMALALIMSINMISVFGINLSDNNVEIKDTFRMYIINPIKI